MSRVLVALGGVLLGLLIIVGVLGYLNSLGISTGWLGFLLVIVGIFTLGRVGRDDYVPSFVIIVFGLCVMAHAVHLWSSNRVTWLWPLLIILVSLLLLVYHAGRVNES